MDRNESPDANVNHPGPPAAGIVLGQKPRASGTPSRGSPCFSFPARMELFETVYVGDGMVLVVPLPSLGIKGVKGSRFIDGCAYEMVRPFSQ